MSKRKNGELEAILILEDLGVEIDKDYCDDNSYKSMPDIRCKDGRYIEVTHTLHNNDNQTKVSKYYQLQPEESVEAYFERHLKVETECSQALNRINSNDYEKDDIGRSTLAGQAQYKKDVKIVKDHLGYDVTENDLYKQHSEFKCDHPSILFSANNILREITVDKGKKYPSGNVDLFIFVADEEFRLMKQLISEMNWNGTAKSFLNQIFLSPFPKIQIILSLLVSINKKIS